MADLEPEQFAEYVAPDWLEQRWYRDRFGIHDHPEEWPLNMTKRSHEFCRPVWEERRSIDMTLYEQVKAALGIRVFEAKLALTDEDKAEIDAAYEESARCQRESWAASQTDVVGGGRIDRRDDGA